MAADVQREYPDTAFDAIDNVWVGIDEFFLDAGSSLGRGAQSSNPACWVNRRKTNEC